MTRAASRAFLLVLLAFTADRLILCARKGDRPLRHLDAVSETNSSYAAGRFVQDGFGATSFLPRYERPLNLDSGSEAILESDIYTHYFPGPDFVLALGYALFGVGPRVFQWMRLVPLVVLLAAAVLFLELAERHLWRQNAWVKPVVCLFLLGVPAVRDWALSLHGHAYTSACLLFGLSLGLAADARPRKTVAVAALALGFLSNYMLLTAAFVVFGAPLVGSLLSAGRRSHWPALVLSALVALGLLAAFGLHFAQVAEHFGLREARLDQFGVMAARAGVGAGTGILDLLRQYEADVARFFGLGPAAMLALCLWAAWYHRGPDRDRLGLALASVAAAAASWTWVFLMREHSAKHGHVNPRIFLLLYACCLATLGSLSAGRGVPLSDQRRGERDG